MQITPHFSLGELTHSTTAIRKRIDNTPDERVVKNLFILANGLERVRVVLRNSRMYLHDAFRCLLLNIAVGGSDNSAHMDGLAADFVCPDYGTPQDIVRAIMASDIPFDQLIFEGTWVHISFAPTLRRQVLTAHFHPDGITYTKGVEG